MSEHMIQHWKPRSKDEMDQKASERVELGRITNTLDAQTVAPFVILLLRQVLLQA
jgi:hypothetical protein